jgi:zona occludens toxin (predicted ATPase)
MIQLIEAPPRSGKSYFAVNYLCKFTTYDSLYHEYILESNTLIISNIEGLKINHWKLGELLKKQTLVEFFTIENFESIMASTGKTRVIIAIDEVHELFPAGFKDQNIYNFFAYHGHIGLDIILMTQSLDATTRMFNPLLEYVVKVTPRSRAVLNNFSYSYYTVKGTFLYSKSLAKKDSVFGAYKSFRKDEHAKPRNAVKHWFFIIGALVVLAGVLFKTALGIIDDKANASRNKGIEEKRAKAAAESLSAPVNLPSTGLPAVPSAPAAPPSLPVSPVQCSYSGVRSVAASSYPTVAGFLSSGGARRYLLSDGRIAESHYKFQIGQVFPY